MHRSWQRHDHRQRLRPAFEFTGVMAQATVPRSPALSCPTSKSPTVDCPLPTQRPRANRSNLDSAQEASCASQHKSRLPCTLAHRLLLSRQPLESFWKAAACLFAKTPITHSLGRPRSPSFPPPHRLNCPALPLHVQALYTNLGPWSAGNNRTDCWSASSKAVCEGLLGYRLEVRK